MPGIVILGAYILSGAAALLALYWFGSRRWYWHVISGLAGLVSGLIPPPGVNGGPGFYLITGALFMFLVTWGFGVPLAWLLDRRRRLMSDGAHGSLAHRATMARNP